MKEKIKQHFNKIFAEAPKTRKTIDLKQEMLQNALDKYDDMISDGYSEEDAYQNVISSIGDVRELFVELEEKNLLTLPESDRKKRAMFKAIAVGGYIFAGVVFLFFTMIESGNYGVDFVDLSMLGLCIAGLICVPITAMLIYSINMYPDYNKKKNMNMVEEYKEVKYNNNRNNAVRKSINTIIWTVAVIIYFTISFSTWAFEITWIIFLIAGCVQAIIGLIFNIKS